MRYPQTICTGSYRDEAFPRNADELNTRIFTAVLEGKAFLALDNVPRGHNLDDPSLAHLLTSGRVSQRILGASESREAANKLLVTLTGNNFVLKGDAPSRFVQVHLLARDKRGTKNRNPWLLERRAEIVNALLTIILAHDAAQDRTGIAPSRFPEWDMFVRAPLACLGEPDILGAIEEAVAGDDEKESLGRLLECWEAVFGNDPVTPGAVAKCVADLSAGEAAVALRDAIAELRQASLLSGERAARMEFSAQGIGLLLKFHQGRSAGGLTLKFAGANSTTKGRSYQVVAS